MMPIRGQNNVQGASDVGAIPMFYTGLSARDGSRGSQVFADAWDVPEERLTAHGGLRSREIAQGRKPGARDVHHGREPDHLRTPTFRTPRSGSASSSFSRCRISSSPRPRAMRMWCFPAPSFAEKDGYVRQHRATHSAHARRRSIRRVNARGDLEILIELSNRIGLPTPFGNAAEVMDEIARVTPSWRGVSHARLDGGPGLQYPVPDAHHPGTAFLFDDRFPTADGKAVFPPWSSCRPPSCRTTNIRSS